MARKGSNAARSEAAEFETGQPPWNHRLDGIGGGSTAQNFYPVHTEAMQRLTSEQIAALPLYRQLPLDRIRVLRDLQQCEAAARELRMAGPVGFDTESKPQFVAGGEQTGPHIVQFATAERAFIVHTEVPDTAEFLRSMLESEDVLKVGFGLASDRVPLFRKLGVTLAGTADVSRLVRRLGFTQDVGLKAAVAIVLGLRFPKSKKVTTSNWSAKPLSPQQLQYAANDAHASLLVYQALMALPSLPAANSMAKRVKPLSPDPSDRL